VQDDETPAVAGGRLFNTLGCLTCHAVQAPTMAGLFGRQQEVVLPNGQTERVTVDERYIRESIEYSTARIVKGYQPIMPSYRGQVSEDQLSQLVAYIRSLRDAKQGPGGDEVQQDNLPGQGQQRGGPQQGTTSGTPDKTPGGPGSGAGTNSTPQD
jgi:cytochrome c oxidase subunit 2